MGELIDLTVSSDDDDSGELPHWLVSQQPAQPCTEHLAAVRLHTPAPLAARTLTAEACAAVAGGLHAWPLHSGWVAGACFSADGKLLATAGAVERSVKLLSMARGGTGELVREWAALHAKPIAALALSRCGQLIATASHDRSAKLLCAQTGAVLHDWPGLHEAWLCAVAFSHDSRQLATGSEDNSVKLLDARTGVVLWHAVAVQPGPVWALSFCPSGQRLAAAGKGCGLKVLSATDGQQVC